MRNGNILIMSVSFMDIITSLLIIFDYQKLLVARLGYLYTFFPSSQIGAILLLCSAILALIGIFSDYKRWTFLYFIPQHIFLLFMTGSILAYIILQHYADGVLRPWQFILQDQLPTIILTIGYAFAMFDFYKEVYDR